MTYTLSEKTMANMNGLHPKLKAVVIKAIQLTTQDFGVAAKQVRSAAEQNKLYQQGRTAPGDIVTDKDGYKNKSNHQSHSDGLGHAVDLTAYVAGKGWDFNDWERYYRIASAMALASREVGVDIRWGGNWYENMSQYGTSVEDMRNAVTRYKAKHPGPDHIDGPHFELA